MKSANRSSQDAKDGLAPRRCCLPHHFDTWPREPFQAQPGLPPSEQGISLWKFPLNSVPRLLAPGPLTSHQGSSHSWGTKEAALGACTLQSQEQGHTPPYA